MTIRSTRNTGLALAFAGPFLVYLSTLAGDVGTIDSGELAAVCARLQVAHPTGYPLYTLMGRAAVLAIPGLSVVARLNVLSAIAASVSCAFVFLLFRRLLGAVSGRAGDRARDALALGAAWLWGIHPALWGQAIQNEVHALQAALVTATLWAFTTGAAKARPGASRLILGFYILGLSFANHLTVLYLIPGLAAGALADARTRRALRSRAVLLSCAAATAAPLLLYAVLPIRSAAEPLLDWGNPTSFDRFFRHVAAAQYRTWLFTSEGSFERNLSTFARETAAGAGMILIVAAILGCVVLARRSRPVLLRLGLGLLVGALWASGYNIHDLDPYFLVPRLCLGGLAVAGAGALLDRAWSWRPRLAAPALAVPFLIAGALAADRGPDLSRRGDHFPRLYAGSLLDRLPPRAILFSRHWDVVVAPSLYMQQIEGRRTDVTIVDPELLRRSWYYPQLRRTDPDLLARVEPEVARFLQQVRLFEAGGAYDPGAIETAYRAVIAGIFVTNRDHRPVYYTPDVEPTFHAGWAGIPEALMVRVVERPEAAPEAAPLDPAAWAAQARYVREAVRVTAWEFPLSLAEGRIRYLSDMGREAEAVPWRHALDGLRAIRLPAPEREGFDDPSQMD